MIRGWSEDVKMVSEAVGKEYSEPEAGDLLWSGQDGTTAPIKKKHFPAFLKLNTLFHQHRNAYRS